MKIVFFGSDEFSIKALDACLHNGAELALVVTTPAKKKGRGLHLEPSVVSAYCKTKGIPVEELPSLKDPNVAEMLLALRPDIFVVASYGKLIPADLLSIPKYRLNVHPSLLPKYRGSAPVNWPILNGDDETGVTILDIAEKLDSGDIYCQEKLQIGPRTNARELHAQLAALSYGLLKKVLEDINHGRLRGTPQNESNATVARQLEKKDGEISFSMTSAEIDRKVRGLQPWPGCYFFLKGERIGLLESEPAEVETDKGPGAILAIEKNGALTVAASDGAIKILSVKPDGKQSMTGADLAHGRHLKAGDVLG